MASIKRAATAIAAILVREGVDYAQSKAIFKAARERAGLRATPEHRGGVDRLTVEEELRFLDQAYSQDGRTGLMLQTLLETGARASELVQLRVEDVSLVERVITIRQGKGGGAGRCRSDVTWHNCSGCISARDGRGRCLPAVRPVQGQRHTC
jgi:integrase/recombinase XerD